MRNLVKYPITTEEILNCLRDIQDNLVCHPGDLTSSALEFAIDDVIWRAMNDTGDLGPYRKRTIPRSDHEGGSGEEGNVGATG
jgi:hypothetical protein